MQKKTKRGQKNEPERFRLQRLLVAALNDELEMSRTRHPSVDDPRFLPDARRLARTVLRLQRLVRGAPKSLIYWEDDTPDGRNLSRLNKIIGKYVAFPHISSNSSGKWRFSWEAQVGYDNSEHRILGGWKADEMPVVLGAVRLTELGEIWRIRCCPIDRRWFAARTQTSRFCEGKCRDAFHQKNPLRQEKRREYARNLYRLHRDKNVK